MGLQCAIAWLIEVQSLRCGGAESNAIDMHRLVNKFAKTAATFIMKINIKGTEWIPYQPLMYQSLSIQPADVKISLTLLEWDRKDKKEASRLIRW